MVIPVMVMVSAQLSYPKEVHSWTPSSVETLVIILLSQLWHLIWGVQSIQKALY